MTLPPKKEKQTSENMAMRFFVYLHTLMQIFAIAEKRVKCNLHFWSFLAHISLQFFVYLYNYARIIKYIKLSTIVTINVKFSTLCVNKMLNPLHFGMLLRNLLYLCKKISKINVF